MSDLRTHLVTARTVAQRLRAAHRAGAKVEEIPVRCRSVI